ncbi:unnamed protein product [Nyctereutes procyonoides]|uniref:(raccoon dog) hypothetical protein n=1 Tax=Nyctereutes procyonoides TaxID=34880 RepID=A0A811ZPH2_NYCPR|nr:unnamed protein product [Nyctereutes procyonoides]|eukprot:XP_022282867.1 thymosin beta-4-like [Canis lupus familiaris]
MPINTSITAYGGRLPVGESQTGLWTLLTLTVFSTSSETTSDKPNLAEIEKFNKPKLKAEMEETNPLFCKETVELEKRTQES